MKTFLLGLCIALILGACEQAEKGPNLSVILADKPAKTLSKYGLTQMGADGFKPALSVHAYDLVNPLFTDYAAKHRYVFVPHGKQVQKNEADGLSFPIGTVLVKNFGYAPDMRKPSQQAYLVETRLLIRKKQGWKAYPYVWNEDQTEALYAPVGKKLNIQTIAPNGESLDFSYAVPNVNQCKTCHQSGHDIIPIGTKIRNLNHNDQIQNWVDLGILQAVRGVLGSVPDAFDNKANLNLRARAYLDVNCAHCHKSDGSASNSGLWLNLEETSPIRLGINKHPTAAGRGAGGFIYVIKPGAPQNSILTYRMNSNAAGIAMPELGRSLSHKEGVALIRAWIDNMEPQ